MENKLLHTAMKMAAELRSFNQAAIESGNGPLESIEDLLWEWETASSILMGILYEMGKAGYSVAIGQPLFGEPDEVFMLSEYQGVTGARQFARAAHEWHDAMDVVDLYFFESKECGTDGWLAWVPGNCPGEQLADYSIGGDLEQIIEGIEA